MFSALGVAGLPRHQFEVDAECLSGLVDTRSVRHVKEYFRGRGAGQPGILLKLAFKLAGIPSGVAKRNEKTFGSVTI